MTIKDLKPGQSGIVTRVGGQGALRQHFLDMGVIPGVKVTLIKLAPLGDPMELQLHGYELTLRLDDAAKINIKPVTAPAEADDATGKTEAAPAEKRETAHPGLGEEGKFHPKGTGTPLPDDTLLTFALVGNQNSGKTTLFNQLTGASQHVGNFPGVTVDRKDGVIKGVLKSEHGCQKIDDIVESEFSISFTAYAGSEGVEIFRFVLMLSDSTAQIVGYAAGVKPFFRSFMPLCGKVLEE